MAIATRRGAMAETLPRTMRAAVYHAPRTLEVGGGAARDHAERDPAGAAYLVSEDGKRLVLRAYRDDQFLPLMVEVQYYDWSEASS